MGWASNASRTPNAPWSPDAFWSSASTRPSDASWAAAHATRSAWYAPGSAWDTLGAPGDTIRAAWRIKAPTALTRCPLHRTWYRNPPCRKAPATPRLPCPNTTLPTHHTPPTQAHTPHTLTPLLTSLRAGKTLISTSLKTSLPQQLSPRMLQTIKNYSIYSLSSKVCYYDQ